MSPINRNYIFYLEDMLLSMNRIEEYTEGLDFKRFKLNYMVVDAVIRNFEVIGEASKNIPPEIKHKYPEIPWGKMYGLRNMISHEYFGIDYEMLWEIAKNNLPENQADLQEIISKEKAEGGNQVGSDID